MSLRRLMPLALAVFLALHAPGALAAAAPTKTDVFADAADFVHASPSGVRYDPRAGGFRLLDAKEGAYRAHGAFTSEPLRYGGGFDRAVLSWNADCPPGTWIVVEAQVSADWGQSWSAWYELAAWGDGEALAGRPPGPTRDGMGRVNQDTLELERSANRLRYRVSLHTARPSATPVVSLVAVAIADAQQPLARADAPSPAWGKTLVASHRSQLVENGDLSYRLCGPSAIAMALSAHGVSVPTREVARACWDAKHALYGNWAYLAAGASALMRAHGDRLAPRPGARKVFRAFVLWAPSWKPIEQEVLAGNPVILPIAFGQGELKGAMTEASDGHLVLVRGFTARGDVVCLDPAAWTEQQGSVVYDRQQLHRARQGAPVIVIRPYEGP